MTKDWQVKRLGEVCERVTVGHVGVTSTHYCDDGILFLRTQNVGEMGLDLRDRKYITPAFHSKIRKSEVRAGDILISRVITHTVRCAQAPEGLGPANCANVVLVRPGGELSGEFLLHYIRSPQAQRYLLSRKVGSAQLVVNTGVVQDWPVPFPSIPEQRRIVAILDEAIEGIATAKSNAEKNLRNARELFETYLGAAFAQQGEVVQLSNCATDISDGDHAPPPKSPTGVPFITISNVDKETRRIDFNDTFTVSREYFEALKPHRKPKKGDVLYTVTGSFGIPVLVEDEGEFCFQRHIGLVRPRPDVDSRWLMYALLSPQVRAQAEACATGTAQRTVSLSALRAMTIPKIGVEEQRRIAAQVDALHDEVGRLKDIARAKNAALEELKKSLLHQAFTGAL